MLFEAVDDLDQPRTPLACLTGATTTVAAMGGVGKARFPPSPAKPNHPQRHRHYTPQPARTQSFALPLFAPAPASGRSGFDAYNNNNNSSDDDGDGDGGRNFYCSHGGAAATRGCGPGGSPTAAAATQPRRYTRPPQLEAQDLRRHHYNFASAGGTSSGAVVPADEELCTPANVGQTPPPFDRAPATPEKAPTRPRARGGGGPRSGASPAGAAAFGISPERAVTPRAQLAGSSTEQRQRAATQLTLPTTVAHAHPNRNPFSPYRGINSIFLPPMVCPLTGGGGSSPPRQLLHQESRLEDGEGEEEQPRGVDPLGLGTLPAATAPVSAVSAVVVYEQTLPSTTQSTPRRSSCAGTPRSARGLVFVHQQQHQQHHGSHTGSTSAAHNRAAFSNNSSFTSSSALHSARAMRPRHTRVFSGDSSATDGGHSNNHVHSPRHHQGHQGAAAMAAVAWGASKRMCTPQRVGGSPPPPSALMVASRHCNVPPLTFPAFSLAVAGTGGGDVSATQRSMVSWDIPAEEDAVTFPPQLRAQGSAPLPPPPPPPVFTPRGGGGEDSDGGGGGGRTAVSPAHHQWLVQQHELHRGSFVPGAVDTREHPADEEGAGPGCRADAPPFCGFSPSAPSSFHVNASIEGVPPGLDEGGAGAPAAAAVATACFEPIAFLSGEFLAEATQEGEGDGAAPVMARNGAQTPTYVAAEDGDDYEDEEEQELAFAGDYCDEGGELTLHESITRRFEHKYDLRHFIPWLSAHRPIPLHQDVNGTVWLATSMVDGLPYAVKEVPLEHDISDEVAALAGSTECDTIARYFTVSDDALGGSTPAPCRALQTAYYAGGSLPELWLQRARELWTLPDEACVRRVLQQMLQALHHLHRRGFAHGNAVAINVLAEAGGGAFRLANFGACRRVVDAATGTALCWPPDVTPSIYCPPPDSLGAANPFARDVFSLTASVLHLIWRASLAIRDARAADCTKARTASPSTSFDHRSQCAATSSHVHLQAHLHCRPTIDEIFDAARQLGCSYSDAMRGVFVRVLVGDAPSTEEILEELRPPSAFWQQLLDAKERKRQHLLRLIAARRHALGASGGAAQAAILAAGHRPGDGSDAALEPSSPSSPQVVAAVAAATAAAARCGWRNATTPARCHDVSSSTWAACSPTAPSPFGAASPAPSFVAATRQPSASDEHALLAPPPATTPTRFSRAGAPSTPPKRTPSAPCGHSGQSECTTSDGWSHSPRASSSSCRQSHAYVTQPTPLRAGKHVVAPPPPPPPPPAAVAGASSAAHPSVVASCAKASLSSSPPPSPAGTSLALPPCDISALSDSAVSVEARAELDELVDQLVAGGASLALDVLAQEAAALLREKAPHVVVAPSPMLLLACGSIISGNDGDDCEAEA